MVFKTYSQLLKPHGFGLGLYSPLKNDRIRPGSLGYFDDNGIWHQIINDIRVAPPPLKPCTVDLQSVFDPSGGSVIASENIRVIGKNLAASISYTLHLDVSLTSSNSLTAVSSDIETEIQARHGSQGAALLICGDHIREGIERNIGELKEWGKVNAKHILQLEKQTKKYGFFIVTATRRTKRYRLKCWSSITQSDGERSNISRSGVDNSGWVVPPEDVTQVSSGPLHKSVYE